MPGECWSMTVTAICKSCGVTPVGAKVPTCAACAPPDAARNSLWGKSSVSESTHARIYFMALAMMAGAATGAAIGYFFGAQTMAQFDFHHFETQGIISYVLPSIRKGLFGGAMAGLLLGDLFCKSKRKLDTKIIAASCVAALAIVVAAGFIAEAEYASRGFVDLSALGSPSAELMRG